MESRHFPAADDCGLDEMAAEETRAAEHEQPHRCPPRRRLERRRAG
jgi:hypothetical protein